MYEHFIILYSDYKAGKRLAYHQFDTSLEGIFDVMNKMDMLKVKFPHLSFGFHHLQTNSYTWKSITEYDRFFSDVAPIDDIEIFKDFISKDLCVSALDVANLITAKLKCTHLKLQKLLYLFYCKYVEEFKDKPFNEKFYAWQYGPVIKEVYDKYKGYGRQILDHEDDHYMIDKEKPFILSVSSRFSKTPVHHQIVEVLGDVINEFGHLDAYELVDITHVEHGPWDRTYKGGLGRDKVIASEIIEEYCAEYNTKSLV
ncbi:Panacea domain-containing protein [Rossellomorea marisflavi]|uniref:Panacea domain-containing protein n=1 Tax=Rossellomorea marisflavi TaxID=189381 RepID=UPI003D2EFA0A